ncbi:hypothetical protein KY359_02230 [Candidatus Woesearchaeota archaeon]|nr:hypothetical protein [Candidatus Woesearchaeota archaeon]
MIDTIAGFAGLPLGIALFLEVFGIVDFSAMIGINILIIAAVAHILIQVANIIGSHISGDWVILSYIVHIIMMFPSVLFFLSMAMTLPEAVVNALPVIFASFILMEGMYSFFI